MPMKFYVLAQILLEDVLATGSEVVSIETLISQSIEREDTAISPSTTSPSETSPLVASPPAASPPAMLPLKRAHAESIPSTRKRTATDRMSDEFGELSYQLSRQTDYHVLVYEGSKPDIQQDATKSFHKHFSILSTGVKLTVLEAFSSDFSAKNFMLIPLDAKKVWTQKQIYHCVTGIEQKSIDVQQVLSEIECEGGGEFEGKGRAGTNIEGTYGINSDVHIAQW